VGSPTLLLCASLLADAWSIPALEARVDSGVRSLAGFPAGLYPPEEVQEIAKALEELTGLDGESGASRARLLLNAVPSGSHLFWSARRMLAASGDGDTIRLALHSYFQAPERWAEVLAASDDPRLSIYAPRSPRRDPASGDLFRTFLERNLAEARERETIRALLSWAGKASDPASPRRVLKSLPEDVPLGASIRAWLTRHAEPAEPSKQAFPDGGSTLERKQRILELPPRDRFQVVRGLAQGDDEVLAGLPMTREEVDRLYPYFARSTHRVLRERVRRSLAARGPALASLLLSPSAGETEKRETLSAMRDAWVAALASAPVFEILSTLVPREDVAKLLDEADADALASIPTPEARARLESMGTAAAVERLLRRSDRIFSVGALSRLLREGEADASRAAGLALVSLGAPGATAWFQAELGKDKDPSPGELAALVSFPLTSLAAAARGTLLERVHEAMSLSGDRRYLPLLVDIAASGMPDVSRRSREAAFLGLAEADLGHFAPRLHRLAGDPDRSVRFQAAAALVPSGEASWLRLLLANVDAPSERERSIARRAVERLPRERALELLEGMVKDGTAGVLGVTLYLDRLDAEARARVRGNRVLQQELWASISEPAEAREPLALLAASRLSHPEAIALVIAVLS
jgi:hypothetical protein